MTVPIDDQRRKQLFKAFRMPSVQTMASRTSSITNAFVNAIIPVIMPTAEEIEEALRILGIDPMIPSCSYCGDKCSEWDHLRPLVLNKRPTGYISEIANLVPSCGKCNQSKRNEDWRTWIRGNKAKHSPTRRQILDLESKIARLEAFEKWRKPTQVDFEKLIGQQTWKEYWDLWKTHLLEMKRCQQAAIDIRNKIMAALAMSTD